MDKGNWHIYRVKNLKTNPLHYPSLQKGKDIQPGNQKKAGKQPVNIYKEPEWVTQLKHREIYYVLSFWRSTF